MTSEWFTAGFDPAVLPAELRVAYDLWVAAAEGGAAPTRGQFNPLALPDALLGNIAIFEISADPGSGQGRFRLAGAAVIALHGKAIGSAPLRQLVGEARGDLVEELGDMFVDEDWRLPIFTKVDDPLGLTGATPNLLILPLRREAGQARLVVLAYHLDRPAAGTLTED